MKIEMVKINGFLVGRTFSDRWNLETLGLTSIPADRNQTVIKRLRRANVDMVFSTVKGNVEEALTDAETLAMKPVSFVRRLLRLA